MIKVFKSFMESIAPDYKNKTFLLAVSGGMDSMAMLYLFQQSKLKYAVANVNFNLRGDESDNDSLFVEDYCNQHNIRFYGANFDTNKYSNTNGISTQMAARDLRYNWFSEIKKVNAFDNIVIAHHLDDQVETFFINLIRGTGIAGMHGISKNKDSIIRPLLFTNRDGIEKFIEEYKIPYREDSSNSSDKYQRNYIRHNILPEFKKLRPDFSSSLNKSINQLKLVEDYSLFHIESEIKNITSKDKNNELVINIDGLKNSYSPELILYYCIKDYDFQESHIKNIIELIDNNKIGAIVQSSNFELLIDRTLLILNTKDSSKNNTNSSFSSFNSEGWKTLGFEIDDNYKGEYKSKDTNLAFIDADKIEFPLHIRNWNNGDFFYPLGMKNRKNISDFFIDNKISRADKNNILLLCNGDDIVWVIGHRIDNRYSITQQTTRIIKIEYNGNN